MSNSNLVFEIDFTDYEASEFSGPVRLPEGDYLVRLVDAEQVTIKNENSANFGKPGYLLTLEVVAGEHKGAKIEDRLYVIENMRWRFDQFFSSFGVKIEKTKMQLPVGQVMNRTVTVTVKDGKPFGDNQTIKSEVKKYSHASKSAGEVQSDGKTLDAGGVAL